jgi:CBS domain-containing protein
MMHHFLTVSDVMTRDVVTVTEDAPFKAVAEILAEQRISAVLVRGTHGGVVGVVSETDLLRKGQFQRLPWRSFQLTHRTAQTKAEALTAAQLMTSPVVTVESGCTLDEAARLMAARGIHRLVVVDGDELIGIVTRSDLLSAYLASDQETLARVRRDVIDRHLWDDPRSVDVSVTEGVVTLTGQVEKRSTAVFAEHLTAGVDGVVAVRNKLTWAIDDTARSPGGIFY